ncbi:MAG TPA: DUF3467 domain-containing protein [Anaerolineaceae bacterium]
MTETGPRPANPAFPQIEIPADLKPEYANLVLISHSPTELVMDFALLLPAPLSLNTSETAGRPRGEATARACARLVMSPVGAKLFLRALAENLGRYEAAFGEISLPGDPSLVNQLFRGPRPPDQPGPPRSE